MEKPIYVSGYVRNRRIKTKPNIDIAQVVLASMVVLLLIVHWQFTLAVATGISLYAFGRKYYKFVNDPGRLVVNYYGMSQVGNIVNNVKEMIWG